MMDIIFTAGLFGFCTFAARFFIHLADEATPERHGDGSILAAIFGSIVAIAMLAGALISAANVFNLYLN